LVPSPEETRKNDKFKKNLLRKRRTYQQYFSKNLCKVDAKLKALARLCAIGNPEDLPLKVPLGGALDRTLKQVRLKNEEKKEAARRFRALMARRRKGRGVIEGAAGLLTKAQISDLQHLNAMSSTGISRSGAVRKALRHHPECRRLTSGCNCSTGARKQFVAKGELPPDPPILYLGKKKKKG
jgi:hypothetical protein